MKKEVFILKKTASEIARYINCRFEAKNGFNERSFYGESYSALILLMLNYPEKSINKFIDFYKKKDKSGKHFHWEFNNYAWQEFYLRSKNPTVKSFIRPLKFATFFGEKVTNWILLRSLVRIKTGEITKKIIAEFQIFLVLLLNKVGPLFADNKLSRFFLKKRFLSIQYHCFCLALIGELLLWKKKKSFLTKDFFAGIDYMVNKIKNNPNPINQGRGKKQIFGYGALIYALSVAYVITNKKEYWDCLVKVLNYVLKYKKEDGSFPLVLTKNDDRSLWYPYNNYYDYLPFFAYYLLKSYELLEKEGN